MIGQSKMSSVLFIIYFLSCRNYQLERDFFDPACESVFLPGISMDNFIRETAITTTPVWNLTDTTSAADMGELVSHTHTLLR